MKSMSLKVVTLSLGLLVSGQTFSMQRGRLTNGASTSRRPVNPIDRLVGGFVALTNRENRLRAEHVVLGNQGAFAERAFLTSIERGIQSIASVAGVSLPRVFTNDWDQVEDIAVMDVATAREALDKPNIQLPRLKLQDNRFGSITGDDLQRLRELGRTLRDIVRRYHAVLTEVSADNPQREQFIRQKQAEIKDEFENKVTELFDFIQTAKNDADEFRNTQLATLVRQEAEQTQARR